MTHPHQNAAHRLAVIRKLESVTPTAPTNAAPKFQPPQGSPAKPRDNRTVSELTASVSARVDELRAELATLKGSTAPPAAVARKVEAIARKTAADLSAARREAAPAKPAGTITAAQFSPGQVTMTRLEFSKLTPAEKARFVREGGKLI